MPDHDDPDKPDWSRVDKAIKDKTAIERTSQSKDLLSTQPPSEQSDILTQRITVPNTILAQYKAGKLQKKVALQALEENYTAQLEVLKHQLKQASLVRRTQIDVLAEEFLKDLDSRHLAVLNEIGLRNMDTRLNALMELTDQTTQKLREVLAKNWPQSLIDETIQNIDVLRKRMVHDIMKELDADSTK